MSRGGGKIRVDPEERFDRTQLCAFWNSLLEVTCVYWVDSLKSLTMFGMTSADNRETFRWISSDLS